MSSELSKVEFLSWLQQKIPLLQHMGIQCLDFDRQTLQLRAALAENINDKGTGFGGSISALATLSGWSLVTLALRQQLGDYDVVIRESQMHYLAPATADLCCVVEMPQAQQWQGFCDRLQQKGRARIALQVNVYSAQVLVFKMDGSYTALNKIA
ncbi:hypothetical protein A9R01_18135 ['Osedax' symbiont bacterium Rs2_46_30_T18]|nr:hypothetical protein A9R01_18135 ['Osedax' symbiont bacterium Rs2_46_30_T18]